MGGGRGSTIGLDVRNNRFILADEAVPTVYEVPEAISTM